jgi:hypothetical protein
MMKIPGGPSVPSATAAAEGRDIDALGAAMDRVRTRVAGLGEDLLGLDDLVDLGLSGSFTSMT